MHSIYIIILCLTCHILKTDAVSDIRLPIGGLFNDETSEISEQVFETLVNSDPSKPYHGHILHPQELDSFSTTQNLCTFTVENSGFVALLDARPTYGVCDTSCLLCNRLNISHLSLGWEPTETADEDVFTFFYHPTPELISRAFATLIKVLQWDKFTILYEDDSSFIRLQEVINSWPYNNEHIRYRKLDPDGDNREIFKEIFEVLSMNYHILDCNVHNIKKYMKEIVAVNNATHYQSFVLTALDAYMENLDDIPDLRANVSTLHLTKANESIWKDIGINTDRINVGLETALAYDALNHLEKSIRYMEGETSDLSDPPELCFAESKSDYLEKAWTYGNALREALLMTTFKGSTGNITFDSFGRRTNITLHYSKLNNESQFIHVGTWESRTDYIDVNDTAIIERSKAVTSKSIIRVVSKIGKPYYYLDESNGTAEYVGYAKDLVDEIFKYINKQEGYEDMKYEFYRVRGYGNQIAGSKKWDGLMGELLDHNAEMAVCDITITSERSAIIDFSTPFMSLGISMLGRVPDPEIPDRFSFIKPLSLDVWLYLATSYIIVSFVLLICARMSQGDWVNPHPCNQNPENLQNIWNLYNCMWLTMGAIMTQGCDILPRAAGSRWITGMWWFFALIITASYTANMSTFLSNSRRSYGINDVKDLAEQTKISYGAMLNGSTYKFFEASNDSVYQKIWSVMKSSKPTVFTLTNEEGRDRVLRSKGKYVFFMESTTIEYYTQRNCRLKMIGSNLDSKDYGIAMPKNSPYKSLIDSAIITLQEKGILQKLKTKWWQSEEKEGNCKKSEDEEDDSGSLQMNNTSGIFLVLGVGGVLGLTVAVIDFLLHARHISVKEKVTFREAIASEWRASLNPRELHKPAAPPRSAAPSTATPSPLRERSQSRAVSVLRAATSFINFDEIY